LEYLIQVHIYITKTFSGLISKNLNFIILLWGILCAVIFIGEQATI